MSREPIVWWNVTLVVVLTVLVGLLLTQPAVPAGRVVSVDTDGRVRD